MFGSVFVLAIGLLMTGVIRFWREISPASRNRLISQRHPMMR
jgi:hypothetical protein